MQNMAFTPSQSLCELFCGDRGSALFMLWCGDKDVGIKIMITLILNTVPPEKKKKHVSSERLTSLLL